MNTSVTLSDFFARSNAAALETCDREPIHQSGAIQPIGALLVTDPVTHRILGASANAAAFLNVDPDKLLSGALADINAELAAQIVDVVENNQILHEVLDFRCEYAGIVYDTVTHTHAGKRLIEFVPNLSPSADSVRSKMRLCSKNCAQIMHAADFAEALQYASDAVRKITGYARVKIYQFLPDWSGHVLAESRDAAMPSYLGLHFPASDIPRQVREIMSIVPYRAIGTVSDQTVPILTRRDATESVDLTWSVTRSVSRMHTTYLRNMGVAATFSCSLMHQGKLWGLIAAHHGETGIVPFDSWSLIQEIGTALMLRYEQQERTNTADKISELRRIENSFAAVLRKSGDVEEVIGTLVPVLQQFLRADGFAFQYGTNLHLSGATPPAEFIPQLIQWAIKQRETSDQFQTTALHRDWPPALAHKETACGVLIQPIVTHRVCQLIWFRGPITRKVIWAGRPDSKVPIDLAEGMRALGPRQSFDRWVQEHRDESAPWQESELESAREIFKEFLDIIAAQLLLKEENASLRQFAASAAHDLRAPLRGISMALEIMREEDFDEDVVKETHAIAEGSANRLMELTTGLLELAVIRDQDHTFAPVALDALVRDVCEMLKTQCEEAQATITIGKLPAVKGNERLLLRLFLNLIANAAKYRDQSRPLELQITAADAGQGQVAISVTDNGRGIAPEFAERVFKPMYRLHSHDEIEGSGLGLTICERIVAIHEGSLRLDESYDQGARFVVTLPGSIGDRP